MPLPRIKHQRLNLPRCLIGPGRWWKVARLPRIRPIVCTVSIWPSVSQQAAQQAEQVTTRSHIAGQVRRHGGVDGLSTRARGGGLVLLTYWRAGEHIMSPLKLFVHVSGAGWFDRGAG